MESKCNETRWVPELLISIAIRGICEYFLPFHYSDLANDQNGCKIMDSESIIWIMSKCLATPAKLWIYFSGQEARLEKL